MSKVTPKRMGRMMAREAECVSGLGGGKDWRGARVVKDVMVWGTAGVDEIEGWEVKGEVEMA